MILRRLAQSLKQQNWTAIWIEFVLLVAGVFLGIQVSNWNEERETNQKAFVFTRHLIEDLREEAWGYQLLIEYNPEVRANAARAEAALTGTEPLDDEALLVAAYRATQYKQKLRRRATYDELISTGAIGLIRDRALRDLAMRLYSMPTTDNLVREGMHSLYREAFRMTVPLAVQHALARQCGDQVTPVGDYASLAHSLDYPCQTDLSADAMRDAVAALRGNAQLVAFLRLRETDLATRLGDLMINNERDIRQPLMALAGRAQEAKGR
jgi:hypothetical protein